MRIVHLIRNGGEQEKPMVLLLILTGLRVLTILHGIATVQILKHISVNTKLELRRRIFIMEVCKIKTHGRMPQVRRMLPKVQMAGIIGIREPQQPVIVVAMIIPNPGGSVLLITHIPTVIVPAILNIVSMQITIVKDIISMPIITRTSIRRTSTKRTFNNTTA